MGLAAGWLDVRTGLQYSILAASILLLLGIAAGDLLQRHIGNRPVLAYAVLFALWGLAAGYGVQRFVDHALVALTAFAVLFVLFVLRGLAGGDAKLGTIVALWAGQGLLLQVVVIVAWTGGVLAVLGWVTDRSFLQAMRRMPMIRAAMNALSAQRGVPYGVALACGGLFVLRQQLLRGA